MMMGAGPGKEAGAASLVQRLFACREPSGFSTEGGKEGRESTDRASHAGKSRGGGGACRSDLQAWSLVLNFCGEPSLRVCGRE